MPSKNKKKDILSLEDIKDLDIKIDIDKVRELRKKNFPEEPELSRKDIERIVFCSGNMISEWKRKKNCPDAVRRIIILNKLAGTENIEEYVTYEIKE